MDKPPILPPREDAVALEPANDQPKLDVKLPVNINLLSYNELLELINQHRDKLHWFCASMDSFEPITEEVKRLKNQFKELEEKFSKLEDGKVVIQDQIAELVILESEYTKKYQNLQQLIRSNYSKDVAKRTMLNKIKENEQKCDELEINAKGSLDLDLFLKSYMDLKLDYHMQKQKLNVLSAQNNF